MRTAIVVLSITWDENQTHYHPSRWNWHEIIELTSAESVDVIASDE